MAKKTIQKVAPKNSKPVEAPLKISFAILLLAYGFVTILTPNMMTLDSNGPKFMTLSFLNLVAFLFLFTHKEFKQRPELAFKFFRNRAGIAYFLLMIFSLLSFFKAINHLESILHFAKIFSVFTAAYFVSVILFSDKRYMLYLAIGMTFMLIFDCFSVFSHIMNYINRQIPSIGEIKSVYSNKNILAAAVFVKIPFALWLMVFEKGWIKKLGLAGLFFGVFATMLMSTRSFYIGTALLTILFPAFCLVRNRQNKQEGYKNLMVTYLLSFAVALLVFVGTQKFLYPKNNDRYNNNIGERIASINAKEPSAGLRLKAWQRSWWLIKENPVLGVGLGNWKVASLKYENLINPSYIYQYKAHNDFIETTTETGIFGGAMFMLIFIFIVGNFIWLLFGNYGEDPLKYMFLPAFGLICYTFDAFFNFPQDRPEISALLALYAGAGIAFSMWKKPGENAETDKHSLLSKISSLGTSLFHDKNNGLSNPKEVRNSPGFKLLQYLFPLIMLGSSYVLLQNFYSLKLQRIVQEEVTAGKLKHNSSLFLSGFPDIPDLSVVGEPIKVNIARYLINETKYKEAIALLKKDDSSPYDTRPEYFIAMSYYNLGNLDSALYYAQKVYKQKPRLFKNVGIMCSVMERKGQRKEALPILEKYLADTKTDSEAWLFTTSMLDRDGNTKHADVLIDSAARYIPADSNIRKQKMFLDRKVTLGPVQEIYNAAMKAYNAKQFKEAISLFSQIIIKNNQFLEGIEFRAFSYFMIKEYQKSLNDVDLMFKNGIVRANLLNLHGVNKFNLGKLDEACQDFKAAMEKGDKDGYTNYTKFCQKQVQSAPVIAK